MSLTESLQAIASYHIEIGTYQHKGDPRKEARGSKGIGKFRFVPRVLKTEHCLLKDFDKAHVEHDTGRKGNTSSQEARGGELGETGHKDHGCPQACD